MVTSYLGKTCDAHMLERCDKYDILHCTYEILSHAFKFLLSKKR